MSDTTEQAAVVPAVAGLTVTTDEHGNLVATWGSPSRTVAVRPLTMSEQFDLAEVTGHNSDNQLWLNMAVAAASTVQVGGAPSFPWRGKQNATKAKQSLGETLDRLKPDGLRVVMMVLNGYRGEGAEDAPPPMAVEEMRDAVGNS